MRQDRRPRASLAASLPYLLAALLIGPISAQGADDGSYLLHYKPADHALGDVHPYFHGGECFLYYLKPKTYEAALVRSRDLLQWKETTLSHAGSGPEDWFSPYFVLGVVRDEKAGIFRSFYGNKEGRMVSSVSTDLLRWSCAPKAFSIPPGSEYVRRRDPFVFWIPEEKRWGCVMTTQMKDRSKEQAGAVSYATSPDLQTWTSHGQVLFPRNIGEPECPQVFRLGRHWYLLASIYDRVVGQPVYWRSDAPGGPWGDRPAGVLDGKDLCAAQIAFSGDVPVLMGWIPLIASQPGKQHWGGHLALPRVVHALPDGSLGTRLHPDLLSRLSSKDGFVWENTDGGSSLSVGLPRIWKSLHLALEWKYLTPQGSMHIEFETASEAGARIVIDPTGKTLRIQEHSGVTWSEIPVDIAPDAPQHLRVFMEVDTMEVFLNDRYSLAARLPHRLEGSKVKISEASGGGVLLKSILASEIALSPAPPGSKP